MSETNSTLLSLWLGKVEILNLWKLRKIPVPTQGTYCDYKDLFSEREIRKTQTEHKNDIECEIKAECEICHDGYKIPIEYSDKHGKLYVYDEIKPKITNPNPKRLRQGIYGVK